MKKLISLLLCILLLAGCAVGFVYVSKRLVDVSVAVLQGAESGDLWKKWEAIR